MKEILQLDLEIQNLLCNANEFLKSKLVSINFKERFERKNDELSVKVLKKNTNKQVFNSLLITFIKNCKRATFWKIILLKVRVDFLIIDFPNFLPLIFQPYQQAIIITKRFILKGKNIIIISI